MTVLVAERSFDWRPRARHVLIAASFVAHVVVIAWILLGRVERVEDLPQYQLIEFAPRLPCPDFVWIEYRSGCVVTRQMVCRSAVSIDDDDKLRER